MIKAAEFLKCETLRHPLLIQPPRAADSTPSAVDLTPKGEITKPRPTKLWENRKNLLTSCIAMTYSSFRSRREVSHGLPVHRAGDSAGWQEPVTLSSFGKIRALRNICAGPARMFGLLLTFAMLWSCRQQLLKPLQPPCAGTVIDPAGAAVRERASLPRMLTQASRQAPSPIRTAPITFSSSLSALTLSARLERDSKLRRLARSFCKSTRSQKLMSKWASINFNHGECNLSTHRPTANPERHFGNFDQF